MPLNFKSHQIEPLHMNMLGLYSRALNDVPTKHKKEKNDNLFSLFASTLIMAGFSLFLTEVMMIMMTMIVNDCNEDGTNVESKSTGK